MFNEGFCLTCVGLKKPGNESLSRRRRRRRNVLLHLFRFKVFFTFIQKIKHNSTKFSISMLFFFVDFSLNNTEHFSIKKIFPLCD